MVNKPIWFQWDRNTSDFTKNFIKSYDGGSNVGYIPQMDIECSEQ